MKFYLSGNLKEKLLDTEVGQVCYVEPIVEQVICA